MSHRRPMPLRPALPEIHKHHAPGVPRIGGARYANGILVEAVVLAVYRPGDRESRTDMPEAQNMSVTCDVLVCEPRLKTVLHEVPVLRQSAGLDNHESWEPQPATKVMSTGATLAFDGSGASSNVDPFDTDGDRVIVCFLGNDLNRPVIVGQLDVRNTNHRPDDSDYRWRRWVAGSLMAVTQSGQIVLDASGVDDGVLVKGKGGSEVLVDGDGITVTLGTGQKFTVGGGGTLEPVILGQTFLSDFNGFLTDLATFVGVVSGDTVAVTSAGGAVTFTPQLAAFAAQVAAALGAKAPYLSQRTETE